jgi:hypothetical protein
MSSQNTNKKYLICYPAGGINDMFRYHIIHCWMYCKRYNRTLIIDTRNSWLKEDIRKYVFFNSDIVFNGDIDNLLSHLIESNNVFYPLSLDEHISRYKKNVQLQEGQEENLYTNILESDHDEDVLIFYRTRLTKNIRCKDMKDELLKCLLKPIITDVFHERYNAIEKPYISIHVRNTDRVSDVDSFVETNLNEFQGKNIFLATDDSEAITKFKNSFENRVFTFSDIPIILPDKSGRRRGIHYNHKQIEPQKFNVDCIVDFLLLTKGEKIFRSEQKSGYGSSAQFIKENQKILQSALFGYDSINDV